MLDLDESSTEISFADLTEIERLIQGSLPRLFKIIYLRGNGGYPSKTEFDGDECVFSINGFNPIKYGKITIESLIKDFYGAYGFMVGLAPFAYDDGGNTFMLSVRDEDVGKVYLWLQDEERLELVASSFERFISALKSK